MAPSGLAFCKSVVIIGMGRLSAVWDLNNSQRRGDPLNSRSVARAPACKTIAAVGASCTGSDGCVSGAYCDMLKSVCMAKVAAGSACPGLTECVDGTYCDSSQVRAAQKATGQRRSTSSLNECVSHCDPTTSICADQVLLVSIRRQPAAPTQRPIENTAALTCKVRQLSTAAYQEKFFAKSIVAQV